MNSRAKEILLLIVNDYIKYGKPLGSKTLIEKHKLKWSPALIRNEMSTLEKEGYLQKFHISSGRIPTNKSYGLYSEILSETKNLIYEPKNISHKLDEIFKNRDLEINDILDQSVKILSDETNLIAIGTKKIDMNEILIDINLHQTSENVALLLIITNKNRVINKTINLNKKINIMDLEVSIKIFNNRLAGIKLSEIKERALLLKGHINNNIKNIEFDFKLLVGSVFANLLKTSEIKHGVSNIVKMDEINDSRRTLNNLIKIIEESSVWNLIEHNENKEINIKIGLNDEKNLAIINKDINIRGQNHSIALIGPTRIDYKDISNMLEWLSKKIEEMN